MPPQPLTTHLPPSSSAPTSPRKAMPSLPAPIDPLSDLSLKRKTELSVHIPVMVSSLRGRKEVREVGGGVKGVKKWSRAESAHSISSTGTAHSFAETDSNPSSPTSYTTATPLSTTLSTLTTTPPTSTTTSTSTVRFRETVVIEHTYSKTEYDRRPSTPEPLTQADILSHLIFRASLPLSTNPVDVRRDVEVGGDVVERLTEAARVCARDATLGVLVTDLSGIGHKAGFESWW